MRDSIIPALQIAIVPKRAVNVQIFAPSIVPLGSLKVKGDVGPTGNLAPDDDGDAQLMPEVTGFPASANIFSPPLYSA